MRTLIVNAMILGLTVFMWAGARRLLANEIFDIRQMPRGKHITLPRPASTHVPLDRIVRLKATDLPQTVVLSVVRSQAPRRVRLGIKDPASRKTKYLAISSKSSALYTFKELSTIQIIPDSMASKQSITLLIESDKPLQIGH